MASPEKGRISSTQLIFLFIVYLVSTAFLFTAGVEAKQDAWLVALLGMAISLITVLIYLALACRFPGQTFITIHEQVWGTFLGKGFSALFLLFFFINTSTAINLAFSFQKELLLNTPPLVLALLSSGISLILVNCGLEVLARCNQLICTFNMIIWGFIFLLAIPEINLANFQPVFQSSIPVLIIAALRASAFSFATGFGFLLIFPRVRDSQKICISTIIAFGVSGLYLLSAVIFTIGILGPTIGYYTFPALNASRMINIGEIFTRMEVLTGVIFWLGMFFIQTIYIYNFTMTAAEFFQLKSSRTMSIPLWILLSLFSIQSFASSSDNVEYGLKVYAWLIIPFQYIIPLLTLMVAVIRKLPQEGS